MVRTASQITAEELTVYRARILANRAARLLKEQFEAREVLLFGSLARQDFFHGRSDIDLAVAGLKSQDFWRAWGMLDRQDPEFEIDLVDLEAASPALQQELERDGVEL